jgi:hypothetical protein
LRGRLFAFLAVARRFAGVDDVIAARTQDFGQRGLVIFFSRGNRVNWRPLSGVANSLPCRRICLRAGMKCEARH